MESEFKICKNSIHWSMVFVSAKGMRTQHTINLGDKLYKNIISAVEEMGIGRVVMWSETATITQLLDERIYKSRKKFLSHRNAKPCFGPTLCS